jgi:hypothetical protein
MYESTLPFVQAEIAYRTDQIRAAKSGRRQRLTGRLGRHGRGADAGTLR